MDRAALETLGREQLIEIILAQAEVIKQLTRRVEELEAKLSQPPKTPDNSSVPPSQSRKASTDPSPSGGKRRRKKARAGGHRSLLGETPVSVDVIEAVLSRQLDDLKPRLMRHGYDVWALVEQFHSKPAEIRMFLNGTLDAVRSRELTDLRACRCEASRRA